VGIAIVVLTYNRVHLLSQCVERVIQRTSEETKEIVIWNNASSDGTRSYLDGLVDPRLTVVHHDRNIGPSAYDLAFRRTSSEYLVELDDDIIEAPELWDQTLLHAVQRLPDDLALLSANLVNNPHDVTARLMYGKNANLYETLELNGVRVKVGGPVGGGCAIMSRAIYDRVGGFGEQRRAFWSSDSAFMSKLNALGLRGAYLSDLEVLHAGGQHYAPTSAEKLEFWKAVARRAARRNRVKRALLVVPLVRRLNERYRWFVPPEQP
jgi:GT2 family glycosyltransferase